MIAEWLQAYEAWFESATNMAWFIGFWLFVGFLFVLEILVPAFQRQPERSYRWPTNFGFGLVNAGLVAIVPLSTISAAVWASQPALGSLTKLPFHCGSVWAVPWLCTASPLTSFT